MGTKRTTLVRAFVGRLTLSTTTKAEIMAKLEPDTPELEALRRQSPAVATVTLSELVRPASRAAHREVEVPAKGTIVGEAEASYRDIASVVMHDLRAHDRVDVVRVGRHPDQDLQVLDNLASREHGLVVLDGMMFYYDFGTLLGADRDDDRPPGRHGSRNGSFLDGTHRLSNGMIVWQDHETIQLGTNRGPCDDFAFKLSYREIRDDN